MATINDLVLEVEKQFAQKVFAFKDLMEGIINDNYVDEHVTWAKAFLTKESPETEPNSNIFAKLKDQNIVSAMKEYFGTFKGVSGDYETAEALFTNVFPNPIDYVKLTGRIQTANGLVLNNMKTIIKSQFKAFFDKWGEVRQNFGEKGYKFSTSSEAPAATDQSIFDSYNVSWAYWEKGENSGYTSAGNGELTKENFSDPDKTIFGRRTTPEGGVFPQIGGQYVSGAHGQILLVNGGLTYKDLDSTNGSLAVNHLHKSHRGKGFTYELIPANVAGDKAEAIVCFGTTIKEKTKKRDCPYVLKITAQKRA